MTARILMSLPLWLAYSSVALVLDIIGLAIMVPLAACHAWHRRGSQVWPMDTPYGRSVTTWHGGWLTWLWGNEEDGVVGPTWWRQRMRVGTGYPWSWWRESWSAYRWSALRNPSNNMRFIPGINPVIRPEAIRFREGHLGRWAYVYVTWQGPYSGIRAHISIGSTTFRFWWGWKLKPEDAQGVPADDMRAPRCGFATQFKRIG